MKDRCELLNQGFKPGKCMVKIEKQTGPACEITFETREGVPYRLISAAHLSRPEHYYSIYQSGCNMDCLKCHSWNFTQHADGEWLSADDILAKAEEYSRSVTYYEPRERATSYHALDLCRGCGVCVELHRTNSFRNYGERGHLCPRRLEAHQVVLSPQGFGPARNIIAFTGGDLGCRPDFYAVCAQKIKEKKLPLHILFETNGYGLTPKNLDILQDAGIDAFWLDIKAYHPGVHEKLTGVSNERILKLPREMTERGFVLEVLSLYIPGWVEEDQLRKIAEVVSAVDKEIPFTILAFFPEYRLKGEGVSSPNLDRMLRAYDEVKAAGLKNVRLGNVGVFIKHNREYDLLVSRTGGAI